MSGFLESGFVDTFRERHPGEGGHYTWWSPRSGANSSFLFLMSAPAIDWGLTALPPGARADNRGWRLDYIFVDKEFYQSDARDASLPTNRQSDRPHPTHHVSFNVFVVVGRWA